MFVEPSVDALSACASLRAPVVELHTGAWCDALERGERERADYEFGRLRVGGGAGRQVRPGMPRRTRLDCQTAGAIAALPEIVELNIGHFLIGEAIFVGLAQSVRAMRAAMDAGRAGALEAHR